MNPGRRLAVARSQEVEKGIRLCRLAQTAYKKIVRVTSRISRLTLSIRGIFRPRNTRLRAQLRRGRREKTRKSFLVQSLFYSDISCGSWATFFANPSVLSALLQAKFITSCKDFPTLAAQLIHFRSIIGYGNSTNFGPAPACAPQIHTDISGIVRINDGQTSSPPDRQC